VEELTQNHLEGARPPSSATATAAATSWTDRAGRRSCATGVFDPRAGPFEDMRDSYAPLVWQCRYSGIEVPDALWRYVEFGAP
jgi:hypothetical protein